MIDERDRALKTAIRDRWLAGPNRNLNAPDYPDIWHAQQCLHCRFYVPLSGSLGADWGACANPISEFDRSVMFEHDGCDRFQLENDE
jgi:hypothetical protein